MLVLLSPGVSILGDSSLLTSVNGWLLAFCLFAGIGLLISWFRPDSVLALVLYLLGRSIYWIRGNHRDRIPAGIPVILVCQPLHGLDFLLLWACLPRKTRLMLATGLTEGRVSRLLLSWIGAIVLDGNATSTDVDRATEECRSTLKNKQALCLFTGTVTNRLGNVVTFRSLYDQLKDPEIPVIPVVVDQLWGSLFFIEGGKLRWHWPQQLPYAFEVTIGRALENPTSVSLIQALHHLSAEAALERNPRRLPVHRQFVRTAAHYPFLPCVYDSLLKRELNYGKTLAGAMCLARLLARELNDVERVAIWLPPGLGGVLTNVAASLLRKTTINLNYTSSAVMIQSCLKQADCRYLLTSQRFVSRVPLDPGPSIQVLYLEDFTPRISKLQQLRAFLSVVLLPGWFLDRMLGLHRHRLSDIATIMFSSGSTGDPKGVVLNHANLAGNVESMVQAARLHRKDRILGVLPFFHSFGFTVTLWTPLQLGAFSVYHADPRQAREIGELCRTKQCTIYLTTPTFLRFCLRKCEPDDFRTLRLLICGAEKLPASLADEYERRFGIRPLEGYGCTELTPVVAANLNDEELGGVKRHFNKSGTVGPTLPGIVGRIVHLETGETLPHGQDGLLLVTGTNVMVGYLHKPQLTQHVIREGWYVTGDMGHQDEEGFFRLTGRLSRFAKIGGEMVPLERIEEELHQLLETGERIFAVTCVPDEARGERLVVLHQQLEGLEIRKLLQQLAGCGLPNLWIPSERDFIPIPELPLLGTGKVNLQRLKELAIELARK